MTADTTAPRPFQTGDLLDRLRRGATVMLKLFLGGLVVLAAGILAVSVAMVGILLAAVAVAYRYVSGDRTQKPAGPAPTNGITLDAHRTAHGWTVE